MVRLLDGPAEGNSLKLRRAPVFLRVVIDNDRSVDALDRLEDVPQDDESIYVYKIRPETFGRYHLLVRGKNARTHGGWWQSGDYDLFDDQPEDEILRDTAKWREWCLSHNTDQN